MNRSARVVAIVCIAVFAFTAIAAAPMFALLDALTPIDALFRVPTPAAAPVVANLVIPTPPVVDTRSPRPSPLA